MKKILRIAALFFILFLGTSSSVWATEASLKCAPTTGTFDVGQTFTVEYTLDTRSFQIFGADVEATFDQGVIEAVGTTGEAVTTGTGWGAPVGNTIDVTSGKTGKISLDYGQAQPAFTGTSVIGKATFKAKAEGQAQFNFVFFQQYDNTTPGVAKAWGKKDGTTLSNVLTDVNNCIYVIAAANPPTATPVPPTAVPPTSPPQVTQLPRSGVVENTFALAGIAVFLLTMGIFIPALSKGGYDGPLSRIDKDK